MSPVPILDIFGACARAIQRDDAARSLDAIRRLHKDGPYRVCHESLYGDEVERGSYWTIEGACGRIREATNRRGFFVVNRDLLDGEYTEDGPRGTNGLTEEEEELVWEALR